MFRTAIAGVLFGIGFSAISFGQRSLEIALSKVKYYIFLLLSLTRTYYPDPELFSGSNPMDTSSTLPILSHSLPNAT